jgi:hypothetical protein
LGDFVGCLDHSFEKAPAAPAPSAWCIPPTKIITFSQGTKMGYSLVLAEIVFETLFIVVVDLILGEKTPKALFITRWFPRISGHVICPLIVMAISAGDFPFPRGSLVAHTHPVTPGRTVIANFVVLTRVCVWNLDAHVPSTVVGARVTTTTTTPVVVSSVWCCRTVGIPDAGSACK